MKLLITPTSPYARKARIVILEKQLPCELVTAIPWDNDPLVVHNHPLRKIPVLLLDDGGAVVDSRVICEYLDAQSAVSPLLPAEPAARVRTQTRLAVAEGAMDAFLTVIMSGRVAPDMATADWKKWLMDKVSGGLDYWEQYLASRSDTTLDLADITAGCLLGMLDFRLADYDWRQSRPALAKQWEVWSQRPSFAETVPAA